MSERILVTGGAGYIGSVLVPELLNRGYHVTVLDNFMYRENSLAQVCAHKNFEVVNGDVRNAAIVKPLVKSADVILPLAAIVGAPACDRDRVVAGSVNKEAICSLFKELSPDQRVLMPTTNSSYGKGGDGNRCDETSELFPLSLYAKDKVAVETALLERENAISFRLATVFGMSPRMRVDLLVNDFVYRAVYDRFVVLFEPHFKRNYIHVRDVARAFMHGIESFSKMKGEIYNVGLSDANVSKMELCERIKKQVPEFVFFEAPLGKDPDARDYIVSNAKIEATGYKPEFSLDIGIAELLKGYRMVKNTKYGNV